MNLQLLTTFLIFAFLIGSVRLPLIASAAPDCVQASHLRPEAGSEAQQNKEDQKQTTNEQSNQMSASGQGGGQTEVEQNDGEKGQTGVEAVDANDEHEDADAKGVSAKSSTDGNKAQCEKKAKAEDDR